MREGDVARRGSARTCGAGGVRCGGRAEGMIGVTAAAVGMVGAVNSAIRSSSAAASLLGMTRRYPSGADAQARSHFGSPAILPRGARGLDPRLCVPAFRRVCRYRCVGRRGSFCVARSYGSCGMGWRRDRGQGSLLTIDSFELRDKELSDDSDSSVGSQPGSTERGAWREKTGPPSAGLGAPGTSPTSMASPPRAERSAPAASPSSG